MEKVELYEIGVLKRRARELEDENEKLRQEIENLHDAHEEASREIEKLNRHIDALLDHGW